MSRTLRVIGPGFRLHLLMLPLTVNRGQSIRRPELHRAPFKILSRPPLSIHQTPVMQ